VGGVGVWERGSVGGKNIVAELLTPNSQLIPKA
jgi:hypothetical protein